MTTIKQQTKQERSLPDPDGDFYRITDALNEEDREIVHRVREFMEEKVAPIINDYWSRDEFPYDLIPEMSALDIAGLSYEGYGCPGKSTLLDGIIAMELSRVDPSIATFYGVQSGLAMDSIYLCGSEEQKQKWLPGMRGLEKIGAFGLTEPEVGSGAAGGLTTTARREGDDWILNGEKKWIGNATFADVNMGALVAACHSPVLKEFYGRLLVTGKPKKVALVACMRKLLAILNAMARERLNAMARERVPWSPAHVLTP